MKGTCGGYLKDIVGFDIDIAFSAN